MASVLKHVGKYGEKPCVVVFREVPNEPENCLIVQTGNLSAEQHDSLMTVVQSLEAQQANEISDVLHRRQFNDGSNMLSSLHYSKALQKVSVSQVSLTPTPAQSIPLADVNAEIRKISGGYTPAKTDEAHLLKEQNPAQPDTVPVTPVDSGDPKATAESLMMQAELMIEDAKSLQKEAKAKKAEAQKLLQGTDTVDDKTA